MGIDTSALRQAIVAAQAQLVERLPLVYDWEGIETHHIWHLNNCCYAGNGVSCGSDLVAGFLPSKQAFAGSNPVSRSSKSQYLFLSAE